MYFKYNCLLFTCTSSTIFSEYFYLYLSSFFLSYLYFYSSTPIVYFYQLWLRFTNAFDLLKLHHLFKWRSNVSQLPRSREVGPTVKLVRIELPRSRGVLRCSPLLFTFEFGEIHNVKHSLDGTRPTVEMCDKLV